MRELAVYGAGGAGRGIMPLLRQQAGPADRCWFIDDGQVGTAINGTPVTDWAGFAALGGDRRVAIAVANSAVRQRLAETCTAAGAGFVTIRASDVIAMDDVVIGEGAILSPHVVLTSNIRIGRHFHANLYAYVEHDCVIGDFVTFAPRVNCNGNVTIGDHAYIGANATIRQGLTIGAGAIVGMGAVVTKDVPPGEVWAGNPAARLGAPERLR